MASSKKDSIVREFLQQSGHDISYFLYLNILINESGCWIWKGFKLPSGYAQTKVRTKFKTYFVYVHRLSYMFFKGEIPIRRQIHHICRNPSCINPSHLQVITPQKHRWLVCKQNDSPINDNYYQKRLIKQAKKVYLNTYNATKSENYFRFKETIFRVLFR